MARAAVKPLADALAAEGSAEIFERIEMPLVPVLTAMERTGMYVDPARLAELGRCPGCSD